MKWKSKTSPPFSLAVALFRVSSLSSAAEVLDDDAGEKRDGVEVGFGSHEAFLKSRLSGRGLFF